MVRRLFLVFILVSTFAVMGCKISGIVTDNGVGLEGITVVLDGDASMSTTTDADGTYAFHKLKPGTYTVTPFDPNAVYTFDPEIMPVTIYRRNVTDVDFNVATSQPPPQPPQWSNYQGNAAHTGYVPISLYPDKFSFGWDWYITDSFPLISEPVPLHPVATGGEKVFITTVGNTGGDDKNGPNLVVALKSADGDELWKYDFDKSDTAEPMYSINPPAYVNSTVIIQSGGFGDSFIWVFDAELGEVDEFPFKTPYKNEWFRYYAPTIYGNNVYVGGGETGGVYGFEGVIEGDQWFVDLSASDQWTPAVDEGRVITYTGIFGISSGDYFDAELTVINRSDVEERFSIPDLNFKPGNENHIDLAPVLGSLNNVIVIQGGRLISFDLTYKEDDEDEDGNRGINWENEGGFSGQPSLANGFIYAVYEGGLHALHESNGLPKEGWQPWQPRDNEIINAPMIVTENLIFVSTDSKTYAVYLADQTEELLYLSEDEPAPGGQLALSDEGVLFIATTDGRLIAINLYQN